MKEEDKNKIKWLIPFIVLFLLSVFIDSYWYMKGQSPSWMMTIKDFLYCITIIYGMVMSAEFRGRNWLIGWKKVKEFKEEVR